MKLSIATTLLFLLGMAAALPADANVNGEDADSVESIEAAGAIKFLQGPSDSAKKPCGGTDYTGKDIIAAAQKGVDLQIANQTRGKNKYPHAIDHDDSKGHKLVFLPNCPADKNRMEYPLKKGKVYNGGKNNKKQGDERVVYYYQKSGSNQKNPTVIYCGIITHHGAKEKGGFVNCPA